jgi:phosphate transport system permease protein
LTVIALISFAFLIGTLLINGLKHINLDFFIHSVPTDIDTMMLQTGENFASLSILNGIGGSLLIVLIAVVLAVPVGLLAGMHLFSNPNCVFSIVVKYVCTLLQGIPSLIIGIIVYLAIEKPSHEISSLAAGISLAIILLPIVVDITLKMFKSVPVRFVEASYALGGSYTNVLLQIMLPAVRKRLLAGILLAVSRIIGETAPLIVTLLGTSVVNWNIFHTSGALPLMIWEFFNNPVLADFIWTSALCLLVVVLIINLIAKRMIQQVNLLEKTLYD